MIGKARKRPTLKLAQREPEPERRALWVPRRRVGVLLSGAVDSFWRLTSEYDDWNVGDVLDLRSGTHDPFGSVTVADVAIVNVDDERQRSLVARGFPRLRRYLRVRIEVSRLDERHPVVREARRLMRDGAAEARRKLPPRQPFIPPRDPDPPDFPPRETDEPKENPREGGGESSED